MELVTWQGVLTTGFQSPVQDSGKRDNIVLMICGVAIMYYQTIMCQWYPPYLQK